MIYLWSSSLLYSFPLTCLITRSRGPSITASPLSTAVTQCRCWPDPTTDQTSRKAEKVSEILHNSTVFTELTYFSLVNQHPFEQSVVFAPPVSCFNRS